jgi:hypothetical protein
MKMKKVKFPRNSVFILLIIVVSVTSLYSLSSQTVSAGEYVTVTVAGKETVCYVDIIFTLGVFVPIIVCSQRGALGNQPIQSTTINCATDNNINAQAVCSAVLKAVSSLGSSAATKIPIPTKTTHTTTNTTITGPATG